MQRNGIFRLLLSVLLIVPLLAMWLLPLADTSEPRYAEIARVMAESGDWITPWFAPGVPFWGKPPLSFWAQALSIRLLGVSEFAVRFPSWLVSLASVALLYQSALTLFGRTIAQRATIIYLSCALVFVCSGAVLTDPYLALGTTLCMTGWLMAGRKPSVFWRYSFFMGLAVGLLAKGPLIFLLVAGVLSTWLLLYPASRSTLKSLPWLKGLAFTLACSLPWYVAAEWKTPGFFDYFIVGEHIRRFIEPGWAGDLYGTAHQAPRGTIWYYWLQAAFPWSVIALGLLAKALASGKGRAALKKNLKNPEMAYFLGWAVFTPVFFSVSGNILWTYILPSLAGMSILLANSLPSGQRLSSPHTAKTGKLAFIGLIPAFAILTLVIANQLNPALLKTEKGLVTYVRETAAAGTTLYYLDSVPFSARFYSAEAAEPISEARLNEKIRQGERVWVAVPKQKSDHSAYTDNGTRLLENKRYVLYKLGPPPQNVALRPSRTIDQEQITR